MGPVPGRGRITRGTPPATMRIRAWRGGKGRPGACLLRPLLLVRFDDELDGEAARWNFLALGHARPLQEQSPYRLPSLGRDTGRAQPLRRPRSPGATAARIRSQRHNRNSGANTTHDTHTVTRC